MSVLRLPVSLIPTAMPSEVSDAVEASFCSAILMLMSTLPAALISQLMRREVKHFRNVEFRL